MIGRAFRFLAILGSLAIALPVGILLLLFALLIGTGAGLLAFVILRGLVTGTAPDGVVVFLIGMRINKPLKVRKWLPVFVAMPRMLRHLDKDPSLGLLSWHLVWLHGGPAVLQYWRSFEHLERYARSKDAEHWPAWVKFNKRVGSSGDVGIWHETYLVPAGGFEAMYGNMPVMGLAAAGSMVPIGAGSTASRRAGVDSEDVAPVPGY